MPYKKYVDRISSDGKLTLKNLRIGYDSKELLNIPQLVFPPKQITAFVGPVAAGKSTLLREFAGLNHLIPSCWREGSLQLDQQHIPRKQQNTKPSIALLSQKARLYSGSVQENLGVAADHPQLWQWIKHLNLEDKIGAQLNNDIGTLSLGGHRATLLLRLLLQQPKVLLLDEPLADVAVADEPWIAQAIHALSGKLTVIFVTHNKPHIYDISDFVALISADTLAELSPTDLFFQQPNSLFGKAWLESGSVWALPSKETASTKITEPTTIYTPPPKPPAISPQRKATMKLRGLDFFWIVPQQLGAMHKPGLLNDINDDMAAIAKLGVDHLCTLTEAPLDLTNVNTHGIQVHHFPMDDMSIPNTQECIRFIDQMRQHHNNGKSIVFHCRAGLGRTGLMLACFLIAQESLSCGAAIELIRRTNPSYIQSPEQLLFVATFPERYHSSNT